MTAHFALGRTDDARALVQAFHYSHRWPSAVAIVGTWHEDGGLFGDSGDAVAACVFGQPAARWSMPVLELTRLVRSDDFTGQLSGLVAHTTRWVKRKRLADLVVSFADSTEGHHGGIYQACSWNYDGQRKPRMDGLVVAGAFVPGRNANHAWGTQSPAKLAAMGIEAEPHFDTGKHLYWKPLSKHGARCAESLGLRSTPYPKPSAVQS